MSEVIEMYLVRMSCKDGTRYRFLVDADRINPNLKVGDYEMEDEDVIDVMEEAIGGGLHLSLSQEMTGV